MYVANQNSDSLTPIQKNVLLVRCARPQKNINLVTATYAYSQPKTNIKLTNKSVLLYSLIIIRSNEFSPLILLPQV